MPKYEQKKIRKAYGGLSFSSSPLTSLNSLYSASKDPNFNNAFQFGQNQQPLQLDSELQQSWNQTRNDFNNQKFRIGLSLSQSDDPLTKLYGQYTVNDYMNSLNKPLFSNNSQNPNDIYADDVSRLTESNFSWESVLDQASKIGESIPGKAGLISSKALKAGASIGKSISNLDEIIKLQKEGVEGLEGAKGGNIAAIAGAVADLGSSFLPEKTEYVGKKGGITQTMDTVYDGISDAAMAFGPAGMLVGGIMKGGKLLGGVANSLGGGTDGMTSADAILGSSFLNLTPFGLINGFGGQKAETIAKDDLAFQQVGSSYTGTGRTVDDALIKSGKKYGAFSNKARKKANEEIFEARRQQQIMGDIADNALDRRAIRDSMAAINGNRRKYYMQGGYNQSAVRVGRNGMILQNLQEAKRIINSLKYQEGGKVTDPFQHYLQTLPENQRDDSNFRVRDYWEFNGRPKDFDEAVQKGMFTKEQDGWHAYSVAENPDTGEIEFMKSSSHPSIQKELDWYKSDDATEFRNQYELQKTEPYFKYVKRKETPNKFKEGGNITKSDELVEINIDNILEVDINDIPIEFRGTDIEEVDPDSILPEFKEGGNITNKTRTLDELIKYAKQQNPRFVQRMSEPIRDIDLGNGLRGTHRLSWGTTDNPNEAIVYPKIFENENGELIYDPEHAFDNAKKGDMLIMTPEEAEIFTKGYKQGWPEFFQKFAEGGKFNIIPEGALHARKNNMNVQGITKKGIPVVSQSEGGEIEQQAEIEREEIIFRLEVTKKIEELAKDGSDEAAIEAGKLLVKEILYNTIDNTSNLI